MLPSRTRLDPDGHYARLGLEPAAARADIVTAFRAKARVVHPDVPKTGNASAFVALKQAYDVLSDRERRAAYDRMAQAAALDAARPDAANPVFATRKPAPPRPADPRSSDPQSTRVQFADPGPRFDFPGVPVLVWFGLGAFLCLCVYQAASHLLRPPRTVHDDIRPNAATVEPLSPAAHQAMMSGTLPIQLAGMPNYYVIPAANPAVLWRLDPNRNTLVPLGQLPPFSAVQAIRLYRQNGMLEVLVNEQGHGFVSADHLTPGNAASARAAYCSYNAGPAPHDGELLERHGSGGAMVEVDSRAVQPVVVKLRDKTGAVVLSAFLEPGGHAVFDGLPEGVYHPEFAIGEVWSRTCNTFAAGMQARRMDAALTLPGDSHLVVSAEAQAAEIPEQTFNRD